MTRQVLDRTALQGECIELFRAAIKSPHTRDLYERRLLNFLNYVKISPEEFVTLGRNNPSLVEKKVFNPEKINTSKVSSELGSPIPSLIQTTQTKGKRSLKPVYIELWGSFETGVVYSAFNPAFRIEPLKPISNQKKVSRKSFYTKIQSRDFK